VEEFKNQLIGQKEGLQFALDLLETQKKSIENSIEMIDSKLKEIK
jgi:hypothetical protein